MRTRLTILVVAIFAVSVGLWAADDPLIGTWKLNVAKSKYDPSSTPPRSQTIRFEADGDGVKLTTDGVDAEGKPTHTEFRAKYDGKDYPVTGSPTQDAVAMKRIDTHTTERIFKKGGKVVSTGRRVVSKDGKTWTATTKGTRNGKPYTDITFYDKQ